MSNAVTSTGILVKRAPFASPTVFVTITEVTDVDPGGKSRNKIDTSTHNDGTESNVLGITRQGDPSFKINYIGGDATHASILADLAGNIKSAWQILYPSGVSRTGFGYVQAFKFDPAPVDGKQGASITIAWAGAVTEVAA
jgi:tail tube protein